MYPTHQFKEKFVLFLKIFFPILIYQFANYSASFVDTTMTGQYNTMDLAGVSTATSLWNPFFTFLTGIVSAMVPIIGHHLGRGKKDEVASGFRTVFGLAWHGSILSASSLKPYRTRSSSSGSCSFLSLVPFYRDYSFVTVQCHSVIVRFSWFDQAIYVPHAFVTSTQ